MFRRVILAACAAALIEAATPLAAQTTGPIHAADLRRHIDVLASDAYQGRKPGTDGEALTIAYLVRELAARGLDPAGVGGTWFQPVPLAERGVASHQVSWRRGSSDIAVPADALVLTGRDAQARIADAPLVFAGHGAVIPERGIDQLAGADFRGAVALILYEGPQVEGFPSFAARIEALAAAGAAAVIGIVGPDLPWAQVRAAAARGATRLEDAPLPPVFGAMSWEGASALVRGAGRDMERLLNDQPGSSFRSVTLPVRATLDVANAVRRFTSNNVIGRLRGSGATGEHVLLLGHWDHLGLCRPEGEADRICNGAVDNASGMAILIEAAGRLASGPRPVRDILVLGTTAEEMGLLGAEAFGRRPTVPKSSIVAAINVDTPAVAPAGTPVAVIGGSPETDLVIGRVAAEDGRRLDPDREADVMARRQDGWALTRNGIPTLMASSNASDMGLLRAFLSGPYHGPDDEPSAAIELGGAVEDANLLVGLARAFADPRQYRRPSSGPPPRRADERG